MVDTRRRWRAERINRDVEFALDRLKEFDPRTVEDLLRRNQETNEVDGYATNTAPGSGSRGSRMIIVKNELGDDESVSIDSSTEAAAFRRVEGVHQTDPLGEAIDRVFAILENVAKDLREADRKRQVVLLAADGRRGRESSLQGNCTISACGRSVSGIGQDRLKRGYCPRCYFHWTKWKELDSQASDDPGADRRRFEVWRAEQLSSDWRVEAIDELQAKAELPPQRHAS